MTMHSSRRHYYRAGCLHTTTAFRASNSFRTSERHLVGGQSGKRQEPLPQGSDRHGPSHQDGFYTQQALRRSALDEAKAGNYFDSIALFDQILEQNPLSATDYNNRGLVYFRNKQHSEALDDFNMAISLDPELDSVYNNRANYYAHHGHLLEAILDYDRLEEHIYVERGRTYHLRGDWNCAIADYQRAKVCFYSSSEPLNRRALRLLGQVEGWLDELLMPLGFQPEQSL